MTQSLWRYRILNALSRLLLCERQRGPRSGPKLNDLKKAIFFCHEHQRAVKNSFESLVNSQGQQLSSQADMVSILVDFHKNLCGS